MIYIKDNVLSDDDIKKLELFYTYPNHQYDQSIVVPIPSNYEIVQKVKNEINNNFEQFNKVDWSQIISYPTGSSKSFHIDDVSEGTTGTSVTFLNDDIVGGEAIVEGVSITPLKGRTYFIDGKMYKHSVLNVIKGTRLTLTSWYKRD
tara:strand:+ start:173 stop:613 length:441 start_codon:yes stop_codon:yes gene_type:complete